MHVHFTKADSLQNLQRHYISSRVVETVKYIYSHFLALKMIIKDIIRLIILQYFISIMSLVSYFSDTN